MNLRAQGWISLLGFFVVVATSEAAIRVEGPSVIPEGVATVALRVVEDRSGQYEDVQWPVPSGVRSGKQIWATLPTEAGQSVHHAMDVIQADLPAYGIYGLTLNGRYDDALYPSEMVNLGFTIGNVGLVPSAGGEVRLSVSGAEVEILQATVVIPALAPGQRVEVSGLKVKLGAQVDLSDDVQVRLNWRAQEGVEGATPRKLRVSRAVLTAKVDFGNPANPEDGGIRPGSTGQFYLSLSNTGSDPILQGAVTLRALECAEIMTSSLSLPALEPGATSRMGAPLSVRIPSSCSAGTLVKLQLEGEYQGQVVRIPISGAISFASGILRVIEQPSPITTPIAIPDSSTAGVSATSTVTTAGVIKSVSVAIRITHTYIGDLRVRLQHPDGTEVILHGRTGGANDNLYVTYGEGGTPLAGLSALVSKPMAGAWKLLVSDEGGGDLGTVDSFVLKLKGYPAP